MKTKPIIFSGPMIRALLEGRKTQDRRILDNPCDDPPAFVRDGVITSFDENEEPYRWPRTHAVGELLVPALIIPSLGPHYAADINGSIWSRAKGEWRKLKGGLTSRGYLTVTPAIDGKYKTRAIHRLVCETFYGPPEHGLTQVRHLDGDRLNNAPENLDWGTQEQNWVDRAAHGKGMGEKHHARKLSDAAANEIRRSTESQRILAERFGVSQSQIWSVRNDRTWREDRKPAPPNMPRYLSRLTLEVTDVRVERVQAISEADAVAEGVEPWGDATWKDYQPNGITHVTPNARASFSSLWGSIHGPDAWQRNDWIAAYTFTIHHRNVDDLLAEREVAA